MESTPFLLRDVPEELHRQWMEMAKSRDMPMRQYALLALQNQVKRDRAKREQVKKDIEGGELP